MTRIVTFILHDKERKAYVDASAIVSVIESPYKDRSLVFIIHDPKPLEVVGKADDVQKRVWE